jgi:hypothetical protein
MNTIARKLTIFVLMAAAATTALTMGATITFAASNTHTHDIKLMAKDDSLASSFTHTPVNWTGDVGSGDQHIQAEYVQSSTPLIWRSWLCLHVLQIIFLQFLPVKKNYSSCSYLTYLQEICCM